ncbi:MAG: dedicated sortase system histidine kinase [Candidatus Electronema aureum]|uniref:histidine kinase n=1 Tax=Candidatus Electronema aureum TaxID=2005002 RepID=A0A521FZ46_9BACT|nr:MAG: dedicated sortase system histidine kinase [Candidatus Electronema aureum]
MHFSLRLKLALLSLLLLLFPLLGMRLNSTLKNSLIISQKDTLNFTAQAVAAALTNRSDLFNREQFHALNQNRDLYLFQLSNIIRLDGSLEDWQPELTQAEQFGKEHLLSSQESYLPQTLSFRHLVGKQDKHLYAFFEVQDDQVIYRSRNSLRLDRSDHLQIVIEDQQGQRKYLIAPYEPGWVNGFLMPDNPIKFPVSEQRIHGAWKQNESGYILELRIPLELLGSKLAFTVADVDDDQERSVRVLIGTANLAENQEPGWLLSTSEPIEEILRSLDRPYARIRVVDQNQRIRAQVGSLRKPESLPADADQFAKLMRRASELFQPLYRFFTTSFTAEIQEQISQPTALDLQGIKEGLGGKHSITNYLMEDGQAEVMTAITPLYEGGKVIAAVVVEQTTNSILALSNRMIEETITLSVLAFFFGGGIFFLFAYRLSGRIRQLRDQAASAITPDGHIHSTITINQAEDEIGDLGRTLDAMLKQLRQQIEHRERMADNLEHEMRTPLAGVAASLKNLKQEQLRQQESPSKQIMEYIRWAERDVQRLEGLLTSIREAASLKNALLLDSMELLDLGKAVSMWLEHGWQLAFSGTDFVYQPPEQEVMVMGDPVRLHQALDKLVENAVSFHVSGTPVELKLEEQADTVSLQVLNQGPLIEPTMQQQIFNSMISHRPLKDDRPHMGLGLYIVRTIMEHHGGKVSVRNVDDGRTGAAFTITLPMAET